jgi:uncharacterized protein (TIGR02300 family)
MQLGRRHHAGGAEFQALIGAENAGNSGCIPGPIHHLTGSAPATNGGRSSHPTKARPVAKPELGLKRQCLNCGAKFYDLNRDPAVCPKCGTPMQVTALTRVAAPVVARARPPAAAEEAEVEPAGPEMVSLEEVAADEAGKEAAGDEDIDLAEDAAAAPDDTFLEEEEEGADVADLIDGDIEDDEET